MSKAEEYSFNIPSELFQQLTKEQQVLWRKEIENTFNNGYHKAEKDLELGWEDMMVIHRCIKDAMNYHLYKMLEGTEGQKTVYQDVLKRFKDLKK